MLKTKFSYTFIETYDFFINSVKQYTSLFKNCEGPEYNNNN